MDPQRADSQGPSIVRRGKAFYQSVPLPPGSVVGVVVVLVLHRVRPAPLWGPRAGQVMAGTAALTAGSGLNVWALAERRRRTTGEFRLEQPESIVSTGAYAVSRHPMYFGWWLVHLGVGLLRGSAWVTATLPVAVLVEHFAGSLPEERNLAVAFGDDYTRYAERVPRYPVGPRHLLRS